MATLQSLSHGEHWHYAKSQYDNADARGKHADREQRAQEQQSGLLAVVHEAGPQVVIGSPEAIQPTKAQSEQPAPAKVESPQ